jgi:predicted ATPase
LALKRKEESGSSQYVIASLSEEIEPYIHESIHLPGLRGNPERTYPVSAVGAAFPGTFENYAASVIAQWQADGNGNLEKLSQDLKALGLTWKVSATPINDTQVELQVGRLAHAVRGGAHDLVNIADVGFGVSQTLPVLVALHAARPGQLLYLEQPEIHLHPRAQTAMAQVLANAANRGVRVVAETHSSLLILGIQTLVAEGKLAPETVKLHWFERRNGATQIKSADLDEAGAFGDWPEDFADITLEAQSKYLDAAESRLKVS